jgi:hypothetical protein
MTGRQPLPALGATLTLLKEKLAMSFLQRTALTTIVTLIVVAAFLFGGAGVTAFASGSSLPGDALYPLKTSLESARAGLLDDPAAQARLYLDYAGRRLAEIESLVAQGRFSDIDQAAAEFDLYIQKALAAVQLLAQRDPAQAAALNQEISLALAGYTSALNQMLSTVPADVQPVLKDAIDASSAASSTDDNSNDSADDNSNDDAADNTNDDADDNSNDDAADNTNDDADDNTNDDSSDDNTNDDADDNTNDDADDNSNDDSSDDNTNDDADDNSNDDSSDDNTNDDADDNDSDDNDGDSDDSNAASASPYNSWVGFAALLQRFG